MGREKAGVLVVAKFCHFLQSKDLERAVADTNYGLDYAASDNEITMKSKPKHNGG